MLIWTPENQDCHCMGTEVTHADETKGEGRLSLGGGPNPPEFIAQIDDKADVRWVAEIRRRTNMDELKYSTMRKWLTQVNSSIYTAMQETWEQTNIVITDPKPAVQRIQNSWGSAICPEIRSYPLIRKFTLELAGREIIYDTILCHLGILAKLSVPRTLLLPGKGELPTWARPEQWVKRFGGRLQKISKFASRLTATYFGLHSDDALDEVTHATTCDAGPFGMHQDFGLVLIHFSAPHRIFDEGQDLYLQCIRDIRNQSLEHIMPSPMISTSSDFSIIESGESKTSDHLQAADLAAGIARDVFQDAHVYGVLKQFRAVVYNGKMHH